MDIVYSSSDSYCEIAGISMLSLLENNKAADEINLYLIDNSISGKNKQRLESMVAGYGRTLSYLEHPDIEKQSGTAINVGRWNISTFYRLFLPSMLPEVVKRVLFIDCDTVILQDLRPLWAMDMGDKWVYGVDDCRGAAYRTNLGLDAKSNYINNGVLLIDIEAWRKNNVNALTVFFDFDYNNLIKLRRPPIPGDALQYKEATETPAIVHFQSCFRSGLRPWVKGCKHPFASAYLAYKAKSPWKDEPMRPDDRTMPQKILNFSARIMPERMMVFGVSVLHAKVYPLVRNMKQKIKGAKA